MTGTGYSISEKICSMDCHFFTTHATVLGRCIAGNNRPLYGKMKEYNPAADCTGIQCCCKTIA